MLRSTVLRALMTGFVFFEIQANREVRLA